MNKDNRAKPNCDTGQGRARNRGAATPGLKTPALGLVLVLCLVLAWPALCRAGNGLGYSVQLITLTQNDRAARHYADMYRILPLKIRNQLRVELISGYHVFRLGWDSEPEALEPLLAEASRHYDAPAIMRVRRDPSRVIFPIQDAPDDTVPDGGTVSAAAPADQPEAIATESVSAINALALSAPDQDAAIPGSTVRTPGTPNPAKSMRTDHGAPKTAAAQPPVQAAQTYPAGWTPGQFLNNLDLAPWQWAGIGLAGLFLIISFIAQIIKGSRKNSAASLPVSDEARSATMPEDGISDSDSPAPENTNDDGSEVCETGTCVTSGTPTLSPAMETALRSNLGQMSMSRGNIMGAEKEARTIYVTSCFNGEGKTRASVHLAHALSIDDCKVLLVDANPRAPALHEIYGVSRDPGLMDCVFSDNGNAPVCARPTKYKNLHLMTFGSAKGARPNLLEGDRLDKTLAAMKELYDFVVVDGHSLLASSDTPLVASRFDGVILVVECEKTKWEVAQQARDKCVMLGGRVLGVILNKRKFYIPRFFYGR